MDDKITYLKAWEDAVKRTSDALRSGDSELADKCFHEMEDAYERYKEVADFEAQMMGSNFSVLNHQFESVMPNLMVSNKKAVNEGISMIKRDKNLLSQFKFLNSLKAYDGSVSPTEYIKESLTLSLKNTGKKQLRESNKKFSKFIIKNEIIGDELNEEDEKFLKDCDYLMLNEKKLSNLLEYNKRMASASNYIKEHAKISSADGIKPVKMVEGFDKKLANLNESERGLVIDIINAKNGFAEERRRNFYEKMKNECLKKVDKLIAENSGDDLERLNNLRESIISQKYCRESIVKDIAKLLEIGSILSDQ